MNNNQQINSKRQTKYLKELIIRINSNYENINKLKNLLQIKNNQIEHLNTIADQIRSYLQLHPAQPIDANQRFTSLLTRLSPLLHPREKPATLKFLLALAPESNNLTSILNTSQTLESLNKNEEEKKSTTKEKKKKSAAEKLKEYRIQHSYPIHLSENLLLRDMIYLLQGIDGKYAYFKKQTQLNNNNEDESWEEGGIEFNEIKFNQIISPPQRDLILKLTELGWLYKKIKNSINNLENINGMVNQALSFSLKEELSNYYRSISIIESHLISSSSSSSSSEINLTSKSLLLHLTPTALRLRMSAALISATKGFKGGQLISVLHSYTDHGDPVVNLFTSNLLEKVSVPWFKTLVSWMFDGELIDPMEEFFIKLNSNFHLKNNHFQISSILEDQNNNLNLHHNNLNNNFNNNNLDSWKIWQKKFSFNLYMIPSFISQGFARKIFSTGKSLNFIRHSCGDQEWQETRMEINKSTKKSKLHYKDIKGFKKTIDITYSIATERLFLIFFKKLKLLKHLKAVKNYLLLGRGDFISILIESLGPSLNKPANKLYRHNLTATLESAIRNYNNLNDLDLINNLDVRMLEFNSIELGWDVFILEYKIEKPLDVVFSFNAMEKYMRMFKILWKMKRLEYILDKTWKILTLGVNRSLKNFNGLKLDFHKSRIVISEMIHFIRQIQSYCHLEVIDCGWQEFEKKLMTEGGDLDSLIDAHSAYLDRLISKGLLLSNRIGKENTCLLIVEECFKVIFAFKESIDALYAYGLSQFAQQKLNQLPNSKFNKYTRKEEDEEDTDSDENFNNYNNNNNNEDDEEEEEEEDLSSLDHLDSIRNQILNQSKLFTDLVLDLISVLSTQQDSDLKFLAVRLNFSLFYMRSKSSNSTLNHQQQQQNQNQQEKQNNNNNNLVVPSSKSNELHSSSSHHHHQRK